MKRADWDRLADEIGPRLATSPARRARTRWNGSSRWRVPPRVKPALVDLGCGVGTFIHRFGGGFARVIGVEFAPRIMARARSALRCADRNDLAYHGCGQGRRCDRTQGRSHRLPQRYHPVGAHQARGAVVERGCRHEARRVRAAGRCPRWNPNAWSPRRAVTRTAAPAAWWSATAPGRSITKRGELETIFARLGFTAARIEPAPYPWSVEGMRQTKSRRDRRPWDWICLARKI